MSTSDTNMKLRLSRLMWKMGYSIRREIPVSTFSRREYAARRVDITDIDVLGSRWDEDLTLDRIVCECKSGAKSKPLDRCFWLRGVMHYFGARKGYLTVKEAGIIPGSIGQAMSILVLDENMLSDIEKRYDIDTNVWVGYCSPELDVKIHEYREKLRPILSKQLLNYLRYGYWKDPEYSQIKRIIAANKNLKGKLQYSEAMKWFSLESLCLLTNSIVTFCHKFYAIPTSKISDETSTQLFGGAISRIEREGIVQSVLRFMESTIGSTNSEKFSLKPEQVRLDPDYIDKLAELISRLVNRPHETRILPRLMDLVCYDYLLKGRTLTEEELHPHTGDHDTMLLIKLAKNITRFYLDSTSIETNIYDSLLNF